MRLVHYAKRSAYSSNYAQPQRGVPNINNKKFKGHQRKKSSSLDHHKLTHVNPNLLSPSDKLEFKRVLSCVLGDIVVWYKKNYLTLNLNKTQFIQFYTNHHKNLDIRVEIADTVIPTNNNVKFLGLLLENGLSWKACNSKLTIKLNKACYAI